MLNNRISRTTRELIMITHQRNTFCKALLHTIFEGQCNRILLLLASFALGIGNAAGQDYILLSQAPWAHWAQSPGTLTLVANVSAIAGGGNPFTAILGSAQRTGYATNDCSDFSDPIQCQTGLSTYQALQLTVFGSSIYKVHVDFPRPTSLDLTSSMTIRGRPATPRQFKVYVNGTEQYSIDDTNTNNLCAAYTNTWLVEIRPDQDANHRNTGGRDDDMDVPANQAPGDGTWAEIGPGRSMYPYEAPIEWSVGLGRLLNGKSAGRIHYSQQRLNSNAYTPQCDILSSPIHQPPSSGHRDQHRNFQRDGHSANQAASGICGHSFQYHQFLHPCLLPFALCLFEHQHQYR